MLACLLFDVVRGSVDSVCSSESFIRGRLELHGCVPRDVWDLRSAARLHDDERGSHVDRESGHHGERIVDDDYGQDERESAALLCRIGLDADAEMVEPDGWEYVG